MLTTPKTISLDFLPQLFAPICNTHSCGVLVVELRQDSVDKPLEFIGRIANQLFCKLFSINQDDILKKELPESLCQALTLPALMQEFTRSGTTQIHSEISLGLDRVCSLQVHLPCPELLTITIQNPKPHQTTDNSQAETILANLGDPCTIIDKNFFVLYENEAAKRLWGSNCGKNCYAIYHGRQSRCEHCHSAEVFTDGKIHKEEKLLHRDGNERHLEITSAPLKDATGAITAVVNIIHDVTIRKMTEKGKEHLIRELQASLAKTKRLNGLLPICSYCKKIKDDNGAWQQLESYLRSHAEVEFSQGICQDCGEKHPHQAISKKK